MKWKTKPLWLEASLPPICNFFATNLVNYAIIINNMHSFDENLRYAYVIPARAKYCIFCAVQISKVA